MGKLDNYLLALNSEGEDNYLLAFNSEGEADSAPGPPASVSSSLPCVRQQPLLDFQTNGIIDRTRN
jgi:hypothetical protein